MSSALLIRRVHKCSTNAKSANSQMGITAMYHFFRALFVVAGIISVANSVTAADSITTDQQAQEATALALADLKAGDNDPAKTVAAALEFTQLLDYYKEKGNTDQVCEMQANVYWCKKRMNLESLRTYVAAKGASAQALATRAEEIVSIEVPKDQADAYFERAEKFSKEHPAAQLAIAIRYFEVADRFTGTGVSLKAQRASLDAIQKAAVSPTSSGSGAIGREMHIPTVSATDLPESIQKNLAASDLQVTIITNRAAAELGKERAKLIDTLLREAESAQKKGDLDAMLAFQTQAKDVDKELNAEPSKGVASAMEKYKKAKKDIIGKADAEVISDRKKLMQTLLTTQKEETKKGNTGGALAVKAAYDKLVSDIDKVAKDNVKKQRESDGKIIEISAESEGVPVGPCAKGQIIELEYIEGRWGDGGALNNLSPDSQGTPGGCRMEILKPDGTTEMVGTNTATTPWIFKVIQKGQYSLRICDSSRPGNPGSVKYRVIIRGPQ
jgi:hypothetical protein